jgi:type II secretory pathway component PulF
MTLLSFSLFAHLWFSLSIVSRFERVFEEMLGLREKWPMFQRLVIGVARFEQNNVLLIILPLIGLLGFLWAKRRTRGVKLLAISLSAGLLAYVIIGWAMLSLTVVQIIQSIGEPP